MSPTLEALHWLDRGKSEETAAVGLARVTLLNDLNAIAHAIPHLKPEGLVDINPGKAIPHGAIAVMARGTGLGEAFPIWRAVSLRL